MTSKFVLFLVLPALVCTNTIARNLDANEEIREGFRSNPESELIRDAASGSSGVDGYMYGPNGGVGGNVGFGFGPKTGASGNAGFDANRHGGGNAPNAYANGNAGFKFGPNRDASGYAGLGFGGNGGKNGFGFGIGAGASGSENNGAKP